MCFHLAVYCPASLNPLPVFPEVAQAAGSATMAVDRSPKTSRLILSAVLTFQTALAAQSTAITQRVSVDSSGNEANNASAVSTQLHSIGADGRFVVFTSAASNLVPGVDANGVSSDLFVHVAHKPTDRF